MKVNGQILEKWIVEKLMSLNPVKIILFGSYAYGKPTEDSDLDICVIMEDVKSKLAEMKDIRERLKELNVAKDILVPSPEEFDFYKNQFGSVFMDIDRRGKILWANS
jgi:predicted nucleotidyltransferase